jgi:hypothetical protein
VAKKKSVNLRQPKISKSAATQNQQTMKKNAEI